jgi:hypothetical protein
MRLTQFSWRFDFEGRFRLDASCPWRIIAGGSIALGYEDHEQTFGLPVPLSGPRKALQLLAEPITNVCIADETADIIVYFGPGARLEVFNDCFGYEGWLCETATGLNVVGMSGGTIYAARL